MGRRSKGNFAFFLRDDRGGDALEWAMIAGLAVAAIVVVIGVVGALDRH